MKGELNPTGVFMDNEESIRRYVKGVEKMFPHLTQKAEKNAREIFDVINHLT